MDKSVFEDKSAFPTGDNLKRVLGDRLGLWREIRCYVLRIYPDAVEEWNFPHRAAIEGAGITDWLSFISTSDILQIDCDQRW